MDSDVSQSNFGSLNNSQANEVILKMDEVHSSSSIGELYICFIFILAQKIINAEHLYLDGILLNLIYLNDRQLWTYSIHRRLESAVGLK